jgi:hypothetical protein
MSRSAQALEYEKLAERVARAVERDDRARRRARWLCLLLLAVPAAVLVVAFQKGESNAEWVQRNARVAVEPELKAVRSTAKEITTVLPEFEDAISIVQDTRRRVDAVERSQAEQTEMQRAAFEQFEQHHRETDDQIVALTRPTSERTDPRLDELMGRIELLEENLEAIRVEITNMSANGRVRQPDDLDRRLRAVEERLQIRR